MIHIGMKCDPEWLCNTISGIIALLLALMIIGLVRIAIRERKKSKKKYIIKPSNRRANSDDQ